MVFSWRHVHGDAYKRATGKTFPSGQYAGDVLNQHGMGWCGACYVIAVGQMIEDRILIQTGKTQKVSMQTLLDTYRSQKNACHGGSVEKLLQQIQTGKTTLLLHTQTQPFWYGFRSAFSSCPVTTTVRIRYYQVEDLKNDILHNGPLVMRINADTLKSTNTMGVVTDKIYRTPNHAVCLVGWTEVGFIVRNSWGLRVVPKELPESFHCVEDNKNSCRIDWIPWNSLPGDPGFCILPHWHPALTRCYGVIIE